MENILNIVGIDPALSNFGFARASLDLNTLEYHVSRVFLASTEGEKSKQVRKNSDDLRRARALREAMLMMCKDAKLAFVEIPHGSQSARAMASYGMCIGVLASCPIPIIELRAEEVKLVAVGHKQAAKEEMIKWAMSKFPNAGWLMHGGKPVAKNEHMADAVAAIEAGLKTVPFHQALAMMRMAA